MQMHLCPFRILHLVESIYQTDNFHLSIFNSSDVVPIAGDGLCILNSMLTSLKYQSLDKNSSSLDLESLKDIIWNHALNSLSLYSGFLPHKPQSAILDDLYEYLYKMSYNQEIVDIIPLMIATAMTINIVIVDVSLAKPTVIIQSPTSADISLPLSAKDMIYIRKQRDHYDALKRRGDCVR